MRLRLRLGSAILAAGLAGPVASFARQAPAAYTLLTTSGSRSLPLRAASGGAELVPLDQVATLFGLTLQEDPLAGGLTVSARDQRIVLTPGQAIVSAGGRLVSLSAPVVRDGRAWFVPLDFLSRAVGPALGLRVDVRRASHLIVVGDVRVPQVTVRVERQGTTGRLTLDVQPPAVHHVTTDGRHVIVRFEADALDLNVPVTMPELVAGLRVDGPTLLIELGTIVAEARGDGDRDAARAVIDLQLANAEPPPSRPGAPPAPAAAPPVVDFSATGQLRTVVIDPGHGGTDTGARSAGGAFEKDITLAIAQRLKAAIESRLGLRVLLTREADTDVAVDRRTALANNNKADVFFSLHANAAFRHEVRGAQVLHLSLDEYQDAVRSAARNAEVPVVGGGTRAIDAIPWDVAQIPHAARSAGLAAIVARHLGERGVTMQPAAIDAAPLRVLVGANMPAVLLEMGFLTNADDEKALGSADAFIEALLNTLTEIRRGVPAGAGGGS